MDNSRISQLNQPFGCHQWNARSPCRGVGLRIFCWSILGEFNAVFSEFCRVSHRSLPQRWFRLEQGSCGGSNRLRTTKSRRPSFGKIPALGNASESRSGPAIVLNVVDFHRDFLNLSFFVARHNVFQKRSASVAQRRDEHTSRPRDC